jgi:uncharacterized membrane protein
MDKKEFLKTVRIHHADQKMVALLGVLSVMMLFATSLLHINNADTKDTFGIMFILFVMWFISICLIIFFIGSVIHANEDATEHIIYEAFNEYAKTLPEKKES